MRSAMGAGQGNQTSTPPLGRFVLTWPRAILLFGVALLLLGGRAAGFWIIVLLGIWYVASRTVLSATHSTVVSFHFPSHGSHIFCGRGTTLEVMLENRGRWPVPWLSIQARLPEGVSGSFRRVLTLGPRRRRRFVFRIEALRRGVYRLGEAHVELGDWFGLGLEKANLAPTARLVVYPPLPTLPEQHPRRKLPTGPTRDPISPFPDDIPQGLRPYVQGDQPRHIDWKATARRGELVTREFPRIRSSASWIFLDLDTDDWDPQSRAELTESAIQVTASLLWKERQAGRSAGLSAWGTQVEHDVHGIETVREATWLRVPPRADNRQTVAALELLAGIRPARDGAFLAHLQQDSLRLPWGARIVCVVPRDTPALWVLATTAMLHGHPVTLLCMERRMGPPEGFTGQTKPEIMEVFTRGGISFR